MNASSCLLCSQRCCPGYSGSHQLGLGFTRYPALAPGSAGPTYQSPCTSWSLDCFKVPWSHQQRAELPVPGLQLLTRLQDRKVAVEKECNRLPPAPKGKDMFHLCRGFERAFSHIVEVGAYCTAPRPLTTCTGQLLATHVLPAARCQQCVLSTLPRHHSALLFPTCSGLHAWL